MEQVFFVSRNNRKVTDEEWAQLERELEEELSIPRDSWRQEARWRRFFEIQHQHEEELKEYAATKSTDLKSK